MAEDDFPVIPDLPPAPLRSDPEEDYAEKASNFVGAMSPWGQAVNNVAAAIRGWWADILAAVPIALNARDRAEDAADTATAAADMAVSVVGAEQWDPGREYITGETVWSPLDLQTYRRSTDGTTPDDPSFDSTNWTPVRASAGGADLEELHANALSF